MDGYLLFIFIKNRRAQTAETGREHSFALMQPSTLQPCSPKLRGHVGCRIVHGYKKNISGPPAPPSCYGCATTAALTLSNGIRRLKNQGSSAHRRGKPDLQRCISPACRCPFLLCLMHERLRSGFLQLTVTLSPPPLPDMRGNDKQQDDRGLSGGDNENPEITRRPQTHQWDPETMVFIDPSAGKPREIMECWFLLIPVQENPEKSG